MSHVTSPSHRATTRLLAAALVALSTSACNVLVGVTDVTFAEASAEGGDAPEETGSLDTGSPDTGSMDSGSKDTGSTKRDSSTKDAGSQEGG